MIGGLKCLCLYIRLSDHSRCLFAEIKILRFLISLCNPWQCRLSTANENSLLSSIFIALLIFSDAVGILQAIFNVRDEI